MPSAPITPNDRLIAATRIKAIQDSGARFSAADAEALHALLHDMPMQKWGASLSVTTSGPKTSGAAAGVGNVDLPGEEQTRKWGTEEIEFRCGAYVVSRTGKASYDIRHVGDVDADERDGYLLRLQRDLDGWNAYLNKPWQFGLGRFTVMIGGRFVLWKRSA